MIVAQSVHQRLSRMLVIWEPLRAASENTILPKVFEQSKNKYVVHFPLINSSACFLTPKKSFCRLIHGL